MRYFSELSYKGTNYCGWQKQPDEASVQETIEKALSKILRIPVDVVGCGRTDTGVHAKEYFIHFELEMEFESGFLRRLNKVLPTDIAIHRIFPVDVAAHARFNAISRSYEYHIDFRKNPFGTETAYFFPQAIKLDLDKMQEAAKLLLNYNEFYPFCKSKTDVKTMICELTRAEWVFDEEKGRLIFYISANRFLRGMVRLIVGMCLNIGLKKITLPMVKAALDKQERLSKSLSAPPQGLYLMDIVYDWERVRVRGND